MMRYLPTLYCNVNTMLLLDHLVIPDLDILSFRFRDGYAVDMLPHEDFGMTNCKPQLFCGTSKQELSVNLKTTYLNGGCCERLQTFMQT